MQWFRKLCPFLFKKAPDGIYYWFFINWCTLSLNVDEFERSYSFKLNKIFIYQFNIDEEKKIKKK